MTSLKRVDVLEALQYCDVICDQILSENKKQGEVMDKWFEKTYRLQQENQSKLEMINERRLNIDQKNKDLEHECDKGAQILAEKQKTITHLTDEKASQTSELSILKKEFEKQYKLNESTKLKGTLTEEDKQLLKEAEVKLKVYKELTNLRWDYTVKETDKTQGYVYNKCINHCRPFSFNCGEVGRAEIRNKLWKRIGEAVSGTSISDDENHLQKA